MEDLEKRPTVPPILIVDDEYTDVSDLEALLNDVALTINAKLESMERFPKDKKFYPTRFARYVANPEEAISLMSERMSKGKTFSAIISDNHLGIDEGGSLFGEDFLRVITGKPTYCATKRKSDLDIEIGDLYSCKTFREMLEYNGSSVDEDDPILEFLESNFESPGNYLGLVEHYFGNNRKTIPIILLCGNPREADIQGIEEYLDTVAKPMLNAKKGVREFCERNVISILQSYGILPAYQEIEDAINEHPRIGKGVNPAQQLFKEL